MKKLVSLTLAIVIAAFSVLAADAFSVAQYPGMEFANDYDDNLDITAYTGDSHILSIPDVVLDKNVTRVGEKALYGNETVDTVIMNDSMSKIKLWAFYNCKKLKNIYYSKNLQVIDKNAFAYDKNLRTALLRNTKLRQLSAGTYTNTSVEYVALPETLEKIDGAAFTKTKVRRIVIPGKVEEIGSRCFAEAAELEEVYIPASVTAIGAGVFAGADNLTVYTTEGSAAQSYCEDNNIKCEIITQEQFPSEIPGDVNGDGDLDISDVTYIQRELAYYKTDFYPQNCDFNGDCKFNIDDATDIQYRIVGLK